MCNLTLLRVRIPLGLHEQHEKNNMEPTLTKMRTLRSKVSEVQISNRDLSISVVRILSPTRHGTDLILNSALELTWLLACPMCLL